ncbi:PREDICTED: uncharacterized protein LOC108758340 [Trachymyrmex cornetzi]|uniref:uncharacterized protein LOC108758340 n=1 Tax=Trachymyrmex cornetzi TaxID=471704 RepID=UPI00084F7F04|nr:PREDICTED: uncharacterized protein LOC108758340 [Trachymyrmex cornetzi]
MGRSRRGGWRTKARRRLKKALLSQEGLDPSVFKQPDVFHEPADQQASRPPRLPESLSCMPQALYIEGAQNEELMKYMETNSEFATNRFITKEDNIHLIKQREQIITNRNDLLSEGPGKAVKQWQTAHQIQLEKNGNNDILQYPPATTSVEIINVENDTDINTEPRTLEENLGSEINKETDELTDVVECLNNEQVIKINTHAEGRPNTKRRRTRTIQRIKNKIYCVKKKNLGTNVQLQKTRQRFAEISESNAKALQLFAEAAMKQANAAMIAAENDRQRNVLDEQRLTLNEKKLQIDKDLLQTMNSVHRLMEKILDKN